MRLLDAKKPSMTALGEDFVKARESRKLSISDAAQQLHIRPEFIAAIESEDWATVGDVISLRGLLRTYARFLGLDGGAIVQRFNQDYAADLIGSHGIDAPRKPDFQAVAIVAVGIVAIVVVFFSMTQFVQRVRTHRTAVVSASPRPRLLPLRRALPAPRPRVASTPRRALPTSRPSPKVAPTPRPASTAPR